MRVTENVTRESTNKLFLKFVVSVRPQQDKNFFTYTSPAYFCGVNVFQVKIDIAWYLKNNQKEIKICFHVRFIKMLTQDDLIYICKVSSSKIKVTDFSFTDNEKWYQFHCFQNVSAYNNYSDLNFDHELDLSVIIDIAPRFNQFANLYEDTEWTDFKLHCEKGTVNVHKAILASASPVFHKMLSGQWKETNEGHVKIPVASIEVLERLKEYIYLQNLPDEDLESLIELGSCYMMPELLQRCTVKLVNNLSVDNVLPILDIATKFKVTNLLLYILKYVKNGLINLDNVPELAGWNECLPSEAQK